MSNVFVLIIYKTGITIVKVFKEFDTLIGYCQEVFKDRVIPDMDEPSVGESCTAVIGDFGASTIRVYNKEVQ